MIGEPELPGAKPGFEFSQRCADGPKRSLSIERGFPPVPIPGRPPEPMPGKPPERPGIPPERPGTPSDPRPGIPPAPRPGIPPESSPGKPVPPASELGLVLFEA